MIKEFLWLLAFALCVMGSVLYRRFVIHKALRKLYQLRQQDSEERYMNAIDAMDVRLYFPAYTRELLKLNYYVDQKQQKQVLEHYQIIRQMKTKSDNEIAMYSSLFSYFLEQRDEIHAKECCRELYRLLEHRTEQKYIAILNEVRQLDGIYLQQDLSWIEILEDVCTQVKDPESLSVLKYRLAKLYMMAKQPQISKQLLLDAINCTNHEANKRKLNDVLHHPQELI